MQGKHLFVTVGTTKFEKLIDAVTQQQILDKLSQMGFKTIQLQTGSGSYEAKTHSNIKIDYCSYFENFHEEIKKADLVISHAGAGSCLDVLRLGKPLIVVVNEDLMDNHQIELAEQLQNDGYLYYCTCSNLREVFDKNLDSLKEFPQLDKSLFGNYVDKCMGFI